VIRDVFWSYFNYSVPKDNFALMCD